MLEKEELRRRFREYMSKYEKGYNEFNHDEEFEWLEESVPSFIWNNYISAYQNPLIGECIFQQIFAGIDALPDERNPFHQMMKRIEEEYGLDRDIVDVSCGAFPALSYEIAKRKTELGIEKGRIIAFDPHLVVDKIDGITLVKENFTLATPLPKDALLVGRKPCEATETMIRQSSIRNLEIYIQMCHCEHVPQAYKLSHKETRGLSIMEMYVEELIRNTLPTGFRVEKEKVHEKVGEKEEQNSYETVFKTKKMR